MNAFRTPTSPPTIDNLQWDGKRPLFSIMIPTYNCGNYLKDTLESVLEQDLGVDHMQIEVVDDCSTDVNVEQIVREVGKGRVGFFGQKQNVGSLRNFESCLNRCKGKYVHILHGDDLVKPGFYKEIKTLFETHPTIGAAFTGLSVINESGNFLYYNDTVQNTTGIISDWLLKISKAQCLRTCSIVVKREVYEKLGGYFGVHYGEDWEMFVRIAANYPVAYTPKNLAAYRIHNNNISTRYLATAQNVKDIKTVINIIQQYLPVRERKTSKSAAKQNFAIHFAFNALAIYKTTKNAKVALKQAHAAFRLCPTNKTIISLLKLYAKIIIDYRR